MPFVKVPKFSRNVLEGFSISLKVNENSALNDEVICWYIQEYFYFALGFMLQFVLQKYLIKPKNGNIDKSAFLKIWPVGKLSQRLVQLSNASETFSASQMMVTRIIYHPALWVSENSCEMHLDCWKFSSYNKGHLYRNHLIRKESCFNPNKLQPLETETLKQCFRVQAPGKHCFTY